MEITNPKWYYALALAGEAGELANFAKKEWRDGGDRTGDIRLEAADVQIYLYKLANAYGFDLSDAVTEKLAINKSRDLPDGTL